MTPSSEERREVAARLSACVPEINGTRDFAMFLNHWIGVGNVNVDGQFSVKSDRRTAEMTLEKLADLIDPTCAVADYGHPDGHTVCRGCLSCYGVWYEDVYDMPYTHCPRCGARVVSD